MLAGSDKIGNDTATETSQLAVGFFFTHHGLLSESADLLDGARGALLEGNTVHLLSRDSD